MSKNNFVSSNIYDQTIVLLIVLQFFGTIGGALQPVRVFSLLLAPFMIHFFARNTSISKSYSNLEVFSIFWVLWGCISLIWVFDIWAGIKEISYLILYFLTVFVFIYLAINANKPQSSILKGWICLFLLTVPIALIELWYDVHLPMNIFDAEYVRLSDGQIVLRNVCSVTYGNLNAYNLILCYIAPFLFIGLFFKNRGGWNKVFLIILIVIISYFVLKNGSRGALLCLSLTFVVYIFFLDVKKLRRVLVVLGSVMVLALFIFPNILDFATLSFARLVEGGVKDEARSMNILGGLESFVDSGFWGIGAANLPAILFEKYQVLNVSPHNLFLEVLQYGLVIFLGFIYMIIKIFYIASKNPKKANRFLVYSALITFPISSVIDSSLLLSMPLWLFLCSLYIYANKEFNRE